MNIGEQTRLQEKLRELVNATTWTDRSQLAKELLAEFFPEDPLNKPHYVEKKLNGGW